MWFSNRRSALTLFCHTDITWSSLKIINRSGLLNLLQRTARNIAQHKTINLIFFMRFFCIVRFSSMNLVDDKSSDKVRMLHPPGVSIVPREGKEPGYNREVGVEARGPRLGHPKVREGGGQGLLNLRDWAGPQGSGLGKECRTCVFQRSPAVASLLSAQRNQQWGCGAPAAQAAASGAAGRSPAGSRRPQQQAAAT